LNETIKELCAPHFWAIILTAAAVIFLVAGGQNLKPLIKALINRLSGEHVEVNVIGEGGEMPGKQKEFCKTCGLGDIPKNCPFHEAEHERSKRNEDEIKNLWTQQGVLRTEIMGKLDAIERGNRQIILALAKAGRLRPGDFETDGT
jgi:hypothetical protein